MVQKWPAELDILRSAFPQHFPSTALEALEKANGCLETAGETLLHTPKDMDETPQLMKTKSGREVKNPQSSPVQRGGGGGSLRSPPAVAPPRWRRDDDDAKKTETRGEILEPSVERRDEGRGGGERSDGRDDKKDTRGGGATTTTTTTTTFGRRRRRRSDDCFGRRREEGRVGVRSMAVAHRGRIRCEEILEEKRGESFGMARKEGNERGGAFGKV